MTVVLAVVVVVLSSFLAFDTAGFFGLAIAFFIFLAGWVFLMMGVMQKQQTCQEKKESRVQPQVIREVVKVRCQPLRRVEFRDQ